eukprot:1140451-Pelagomonas_calceolata.AAC.4
MTTSSYHPSLTHHASSAKTLLSQWSRRRVTADDDMTQEIRERLSVFNLQQGLQGALMARRERIPPSKIRRPERHNTHRPRKGTRSTRVSETCTTGTRRSQLPPQIAPPPPLTCTHQHTSGTDGSMDVGGVSSLLAVAALPAPKMLRRQKGQAGAWALLALAPTTCEQMRAYVLYDVGACCVCVRGRQRLGCCWHLHPPAS